MDKIKLWIPIILLFISLTVSIQIRTAHNNSITYEEVNMMNSCDDIVIDNEIKNSRSDEEKTVYTDEKLNEAYMSSKYNEMSLGDRKEFAYCILSKLEKNGCIRGLSYSDEGFMYSFEYADGTLGGWRIKDFSQEEGQLPMN